MVHDSISIHLFALKSVYGGVHAMKVDLKM